MWFKNVHAFRLLEPFSKDDFEQKLLENQIRPCGKIERMTFGWAAPMGGEEMPLVVVSQDKLLISAKKIEKLLPTTVVKEHALERIAEIEADQDRKVGAREKRAIMEEMTLTLLPKAFTKSSRINAYIDVGLGLLIIDTSSTAKAEELTVLLRQTLGQLKIKSIEVNDSIRHHLTRWLVEDAPPQDFYLERDCEIQDPRAEKTKIKCSNLDLPNKEIEGLIEKGTEVIQLGLTWSDRLSFIVDENLVLRKLEFLDLVQDQVDDAAAETDEERFMADFTIFSSEIEAMLPLLYTGLGGLVPLENAQEERVEDALPA